jgi:RNA polymerase sigma-70 factor (ECF subfamily)
VSTPTPFEREHGTLIDRLYRDAHAERWGLSRGVFAWALERSAAHRFAGDAAAAEVARYLQSLHVADLALAAACIEGVDAAWEHFVLALRPELYAAARAIAGDSGREIADSLYADLYGVDRASGKRSLLTYFHGRSKLSTWLRAILAQRHVDLVRERRRFEPVDEAAALPADPKRAAADPDPKRSRYLALMQAALVAAIGSLPAAERLRLSCYYVQAMTLAQIGRMLGEHEATVSRKLERTRRQLRREVEQRLTEQERLTSGEVALCYEYAAGDWPFDLTRALASGDRTVQEG